MDNYYPFNNIKQWFTVCQHEFFRMNDNSVRLTEIEKKNCERALIAPIFRLDRLFMDAVKMS